jgi:hypothetical protein
MARGWESKSAEAQIEEAVARRTAKSLKRHKPEPPDQRRDAILLSRVRIVRELANAQNPRYRELLERTLAGLDEKLTAKG